MQTGRMESMFAGSEASTASRFSLSLAELRSCALVVVAAAGLGAAFPASPALADEPVSAESGMAEPMLLAQDGGTTPRELEPAYPAPDPGRPGPYNDREREIWNGDYVFGVTRALVKSTIVPAGKAPLFLLTVPVDVVFLPFALIGGFFG